MCVESEVGCVVFVNVVGELCVVVMMGDVVLEVVDVLFMVLNIGMLIYGYMYCLQLYYELSGECWVFFDWDFDQVQLCGSFFKLQDGVLMVE